MEKASKKASEVEVELNDGTKRTLATLKQSELNEVKLDGKSDNGVFTSITLKRAIVKDDEANGIYIERRLFKYGPSKTDKTPKVVMFDLPLPTNEVELNKIALQTRLDYFWKSARIEEDHAHAAGEALTQETKSIIAILKKADKGEKLTIEETAMLKTYYKMKLGGFMK